MLSIGKARIERSDGQSRLCADIALNGHGTTLWFGVPAAQEAYLSAGRADPFVMALLPVAMRGGYELSCEDALSERLHHGLREYLMPAIAAAGELYRPVRISAPLTAAPCPNRGAVGTGFSGGADSLYTVCRHGADSEYPLTHLAVFNSGVFEGEGYRESFRRACGAAERFAKEQGLETVFVDTNFYEALPERFMDVYCFRNLACALALQGLFSVYLLSSAHDIAHFHFDLHNPATFDALTVSCASSEGLTFFLSGAEAERWQKFEALSDWAPSWKWLHPCVYGLAGGRNCGHCKKCARDTVTLHTLGTLERYAAVFDTAEFRRHMPARVGFVLANRGNHLYDETLALMQARGVPVPPAAYVYETQFRRAISSLKKSEKPVFCGKQTGKTVSLSFDTEETDHHIQEIMEVLERYRVKATFFVLGKFAEEFPDTVKALFQAGHEIMNHSYSHNQLPALTEAEIIRDIAACNHVIFQIIGTEPRIFRCPYGEYDQHVLRAVSKTGMTVVHWDTDSEDWKGISAESIQRRVLLKAAPGSIILFHPHAKHTAQALPGIIEKLQGKGYDIVPVSQLLS